MKRIIFFMVCAMLVVFPSATSFAYSDTTSPTQEAVIKKLAANGIITGYGDDTFRPNQKITRGQVAAIITRAKKLDIVRPAIQFKDVPKTHAYYSAITQLYQAGVVDGNDSYYNPDQPISRGQLAKILTNAFDFELINTSKFSDVAENDVFNIYIGALVNKNITTGYTDGTFKPNNHVTRGQFASFIYRTLYGKEPVINHTDATDLSKFEPTLLQSFSFNLYGYSGSAKFPQSQKVNDDSFDALLYFNYDKTYFTYSINHTDWVIGSFSGPVRLNKKTSYYEEDENYDWFGEIKYTTNLTYVNNVKTKAGTFNNVARIEVESDRYNTLVFYFKEGYGLIKQNYIPINSTVEKPTFELVGYKLK